MTEPIVQMSPADYQVFWNRWMWTALVAGAVFSLAFWAIGYWVLRLALADALKGFR